MMVCFCKDKGLVPVAPVLCNIPLPAVDCALRKEIDDRLVLNVFRYVDDFFIGFKQTLTHAEFVDSILAAFRRRGILGTTRCIF